MADTKKLKAMSVDVLLKELRAREAKGATAKGATAKGATAKGVAAKGVAAKGVAAKGVKAKGGKAKVGKATKVGKPSAKLTEFETKSIAKVLKGNQKVIYGTDDRKDIFELAAGQNKDDVDSVVALFDKGDVTDNGDGTSTLKTVNFGTARNLCASERFRTQPIGNFCSGFLVAPDIIATAGHCANSTTVKDVRFVFGFRMTNSTTAVTKIKNSEIYSGVKIIGREEVGTGPDWALVRIDRPVPNHRVAPMRRTGKISDSQSLHVIGHPVGLPTKFAGGAAVRSNSKSAFFVANLDTYGGNSGSPVFNSTSHEVEGVLVRGETDFVASGSCNVSLVCPTSGCRGEDSTRTTVFAHLVPVVTNIWPNGKAYFFKGSKYDRYDVGDQVDPGYPKEIAGNWPGFPAGFAAGIDAYVMWNNGKAYFFKGSQYIRYDIATDKVDSGYPKSISGNWPGLFTSNIDAAVIWPNNKAYFFKGSQYDRYDLATDKVDAGYPKPIAGNWPGFPASFAAGVNAAVHWNNGKAYFFKGNQYIRYDVATDKVDSGYPKPISGNWPGLFTSDLDA